MSKQASAEIDRDPATGQFKGRRRSATEARLAELERRHLASIEESARLRRGNSQLQKEVSELQLLLDRYSTIKPENMRVPAWMKPATKPSKSAVVTPVLMLSDLHFDEVVDLDAMDGINAYNREIAEARLDRVINKTSDILRRFVSGVHYDGIVVPLLGDIVTGEIHDELARTNEAPTAATIVHWVPRLASALKYLAEEFKNVFVPVVDGNHDRAYPHTPTKKRAESSLAWIVYNWLADTLKDDPRIKFGITKAPEQLIEVYNTRFLLSHGDGFRSAGGVGGLYPSMLKWLLRKHQLYSTTKKDFDFALIGHWHQDLWGQDFVVNGSLKGYDEYARHGGFTFGRASQQLFTVSPERGIVQRITVLADK